MDSRGVWVWVGVGGGGPNLPQPPPPRTAFFKQRIKEAFFFLFLQRLASSSHCKFMPLTSNNTLSAPVSDRGGAACLRLGFTRLTVITNFSNTRPLPIPHFLVRSQRYVVFHFKVLRDYSNMRYINNKWNAIELEKVLDP